MVHRREQEMKVFVVFFGKTCYIKNNGFIMLSQRWTICDVVFGSLNLKMYLKNVFCKYIITKLKIVVKHF